MNVRERYDRTIRAIEEHASDPDLDPQELAELVARDSGFAVRDMIAVFKYLTGRTLRGYISERKLMASCGYLLGPGRRDIETALAIAGYQDQPGYTKAFKARFGLTPGEARRRSDRSLLEGPLTWDALSRRGRAPSEEPEPSAADMEEIRFGIPKSQLDRAARAMELEAFYELSRPMSEYAFSLSQRSGRSLEDCFRYLDSLRDYILPFPEQEDPDDEALTTQPKLLKEYADDSFVQEMFFRLGIRLETIQYFHAYHDASQEELLDCGPEMLATYSETWQLPFHDYVTLWRVYRRKTGGLFDPEEWETLVWKLLRWLPGGQEDPDAPLTEEEAKDLLASLDPRIRELQAYYDEVDRRMRESYTSWHGGRLDRELAQDDDPLPGNLLEEIPEELWDDPFDEL